MCHIITGKEAFGSFVKDITNTKIVLSALCTLLQRTTTSALMCLGDKTGSSTIAVVSTNTSLFVFDSHSRDDSGLPCANGTAIVMKFDNIDTITTYICLLAHNYQQDYFIGHFGMHRQMLSVTAKQLWSIQLFVQWEC